MNAANATGNPRLTLCGQTSFGPVKQDCRGAGGKRVGEMHGARERWKGDRWGRKGKREREREREREGGAPNGLWCPWVSMAGLVLPLVPWLESAVHTYPALLGTVVGDHTETKADVSILFFL